jgi:hypothetical protein
MCLLLNPQFAVPGAVRRLRQPAAELFRNIRSRLEIKEVSDSGVSRYAFVLVLPTRSSMSGGLQRRYPTKKECWVIAAGAGKINKLPLIWKEVCY